MLLFDETFESITGSHVTSVNRGTKEDKKRKLKLTTSIAI